MPITLQLKKLRINFRVDLISKIRSGLILGCITKRVIQGGSLARFTGEKNNGSLITDIKI